MHLSTTIGFSQRTEVDEVGNHILLLILEAACLDVFLWVYVVSLCFV